MTIHFPDQHGTRLNIKPMSFGLEQKQEASAFAERLGVGVRMEVHSAHTEFWTDATVPVGKISVWAALTYGGQIEPVALLESPEEVWVPWSGV